MRADDQIIHHNMSFFRVRRLWTPYAWTKLLTVPTRRQQALQLGNTAKRSAGRSHVGVNIHHGAASGLRVPFLRLSFISILTTIRVWLKGRKMSSVALLIVLLRFIFQHPPFSPYFVFSRADHIGRHGMAVERERSVVNNQKETTPNKQTNNKNKMITMMRMKKWARKECFFLLLVSSNALLFLFRPHCFPSFLFPWSRRPSSHLASFFLVATRLTTSMHPWREDEGAQERFVAHHKVAHEQTCTEPPSTPSQTKLDNEEEDNEARKENNRETPSKQAKNKQTMSG